MRNNTEELCDALDAAIFSGDEFLNAEARKELRVYMARWERGLVEHEISTNEDTNQEENQNVKE